MADTPHSTRRSTDSNVSDDARQRIESFCRQIAIAQDLDEEIRAELASHMTEKLLAYLSGREAISESDALLLVEHHFGDTGTTQGLLRAVHQEESPLPLWRRTAVLGVVWCLVFGIADFASIYGSQLLARSFRWYGAESERLLSGVMFWLTQPAVATLAVGAFWWILRNWRMTLGSRLDHWSWRTPAWPLWLAVGLSLIGYGSIPLITSTHPLLLTNSPYFSVTGLNALYLLLTCAMMWTAMQWMGMNRKMLLLGAAIAMALLLLPIFRPFMSTGPYVTYNSDGTKMQFLVWLPSYSSEIAFSESCRHLLVAAGAIVIYAVWLRIRRTLRRRQIEVA